MKPYFKIFFLLSVIFLTEGSCHAQNYECNLKKHWFFGRGLTSSGGFTGDVMHMEFQCPSGNLMSASGQFGVLNYGHEGSAVISDFNSGVWNMYSDGDNVLFSAAPNLTGFGGNPSSTASVLICPINLCPVDSFYLFSNPTGGSTQGIVKWATANISGSISTQTNLILPPSANVGNATGLRHGEGMLLLPVKTEPGNFWLITRLLKNSGSSSTDAIVIYKITSTGIVINQVFNLDTDLNGDITNSVLNNIFTNFTYSEIRKEVAISDGNSSKSVFTIKFDISTGQMSGIISNVIPVDALGAYDVEYSPDSEYLYYSDYDEGKVYAYNFNTSTSILVISPNAGNIQRGWGLQTGPDKNIYAVTNTTPNWSIWNSQIWQITNPNNPTLLPTSIYSFNDWFLGNLPSFVVAPEFDLYANSISSTLCPNDSMPIGFISDLSGLSINSFTWFKDSIIMPGQIDSVIWINQPGVYYAEIDLVNGCTYVSDTISIELSPDLTFSILDFQCSTTDVTLDVQVCNLSDSTFTNNFDITFYDSDPTLSSANEIYTGNFGGNIIPNGCQSLQITIVGYSGQVYGVLNDPGGQITPFNISNFPLNPIAECSYQNNFGDTLIDCCFGDLNLNDTLFCTGNPFLQLDVQPIIGGTINWYSDPNYSTLIQSGSQISINDIVGVTTYYVMESTINCDLYDSITVTINPVPIVLAGVDTTICESSQVQLTAINPNAAILNWNNGVNDGVPFNPSSSSYYVVTAEINGCSSQDSVLINVAPNPDFIYVSTPPDYCTQSQGTIEFSPTIQGLGPYTVSGPGGISSNLVYGNLNFGTSTFIITDDNGCSFTQTISFNPSSFPLESSFIYSPQEIYTWNTDVSFINYTDGAQSYEWQISGNGYSYNYSTEDLEFTFPQISGEYTVCLIADFGGVCKDTTCQSIIIVEDLFLYVPNVFTPTGDLVNNQFIPVFSNQENVSNYHLTIFNRWGEVLFESYSQYTGWDGTYGNSLVQDGVYVWQINYEKVGINDPLEIRGHVTVLK
jgi:gliding motility-associated-like protein